MSFLNYLISGISLGSVYAIIALGYTMVYGIAKMLNFAHGDVIMVGAYVVFYSTAAGMPAIPAVLLSVVICTVLEWQSKQWLTVRFVVQHPLWQY